MVSVDISLPNLVITLNWLFTFLHNYRGHMLLKRKIFINCNAKNVHWVIHFQIQSLPRALLRMSYARISEPVSTGVENGFRLNWKNLSEQEREPTTNSIHIWCRRQDSNSGHIGRRRVHNPGSTTISSLAILDFRAVLYCAWPKDEKSSQSRGSDDRNSVSMARAGIMRAGERNIPTVTAQQVTIDLLKQPLPEINYFIEVIVIQ